MWMMLRTATWRDTYELGSKQRIHKAQETPESDKTYKAPPQAHISSNNYWEWKTLPQAEQPASHARSTRDFVLTHQPC